MKKLQKTELAKLQHPADTEGGPVLMQRLFQEQFVNATLSSDFVHPRVLAERFRAYPDPMLAELGGSRVEVAIGLDRTMYQLEVTVPSNSSDELTANWVKAETARCRPKPGVSVPLAFNQIPVTLDAAITSLCSTFGLSKGTVLKTGVNLLAFWEGVKANERLELPLSKDWRRYSLANMSAGQLAVAG